jgi:hypothetical protein
LDALTISDIYRTSRGLESKGATFPPNYGWNCQFGMPGVGLVVVQGKPLHSEAHDFLFGRLRDRVHPEVAIDDLLSEPEYGPWDRRQIAVMDFAGRRAAYKGPKCTDVCDLADDDDGFVIANLLESKGAAKALVAARQEFKGHHPLWQAALGLRAVDDTDLRKHFLSAGVMVVTDSQVLVHRVDYGTPGGVLLALGTGKLAPPPAVRPRNEADEHLDALGDLWRNLDGWEMNEESLGYIYKALDCVPTHLRPAMLKLWADLQFRNDMVAEGEMTLEALVQQYPHWAEMVFRDDEFGGVNQQAAVAYVREKVRRDGLRSQIAERETSVLERKGDGSFVSVHHRGAAKESSPQWGMTVGRELGRD